MATVPTNNPIPSEDPRDLKFNAGKLDEVVSGDNHYYTDRFGVRRFTIAGFQYTAEEAIRNYGYITMDSFEDGAILTLPNQVLRYEATGEYYRWDGDFPKTVSSGSTPENAGGVGLGAWVSVGDGSLRADISSTDVGRGCSLIGTSNGSNVQEALDDINNTIYQNPLTNWHLGGTLKIKQGVYDVTSALVLDYGKYNAAFIGSPGVRAHYEGENMAETIFNCQVADFNLKMLGDTVGATQRVHAYDYLGNVTLKGWRRLTVFS